MNQLHIICLFEILVLRSIFFSVFPWLACWLTGRLTGRVVPGPGAARTRNPPDLAGRHSSLLSSPSSPQLASRRTSRRWRSHETHLILKRRCSCLLPSQPGQFPGPDIVRFLFYTFCLHWISNLAYWMMPLESSQWITSIGIKSVCRFRLLRFKRYYES